MSILVMIEIASAIMGILTAALLSLFRRFGRATWLLALYLFPASLACAALSLAPYLTGVSSEDASRLGLAFLVLAAPGGMAAACTIDREDWRETLHRRRWSILAVAAAAPILAVLLFMAPPDTDLRLQAGQIFLGYPGYGGGLYLMIVSIIVLAHLEQTLRSAQEVVRWEIKFLLLGMAASVGATIYICSNILLYPPRQALMPQASMRLFPVLFLLSCVLILVSWRRSAGRGRVVVSHGIIYSSITLLSVGVYLIVSSIFARWAGRQGDSGIPLDAAVFLVSLVGLALVLLWTDFRHRVKLWIRRNFLAGKYDYRQYWIEAGERIQLTDRPDSASEALAEIVQRSVGSIHVGVWIRLRNPNRLRLAAMRGSLPYSLGDEVSGVAEKLLDQFEPLDAGAVRTGVRDDAVIRFHETAKASLLVPLQSSGRLVGLLTVGSDRSGQPYSWDAREFLGVLGGHAAAEFHKADLLASLVKAKETEAFRTFSTFLLHDLKNFASTLSLIARNAEKHHQNPDFQRDAFRSVFETAEKMKRLCNNLRAFSTPPALNRRACNLNDLVRQAADNISVELGAGLRLELEELPSVELDPEEMMRVVQNLVLNAREAIPADGWIAVRTRSDPKGVILEVEDNGRGIGREFLEKELFLPFRTTKSDGLGIGLFQCRTTVEAHDGTIRVESTEGEGTIVTVLLPVRRSAAVEGAGVRRQAANKVVQG